MYKTHKIETPTETPKTMVILAPQKIGKTSALLQLKNCLFIDLQDSSHYFKSNAEVFNAKQAYKDYLETKPDKPLDYNSFLLGFLKHVKNNKNYDYIVMDTAYEFERTAALELGVYYHKQTKAGSNFNGTADDLEGIPMGAGYGSIRKAFLKIIDDLAEKVNKTLILVVHPELRSVNYGSEELTVKQIRLTGKLADIVASHVDSIGVLVRDPNNEYKNLIDFRHSPENHNAGSRTIVPGLYDFSILHKDKNEVELIFPFFQ